MEVRIENEEMSDCEAIIACQTGHKEMYKHLVERYKVRAYYAALMFTKNRDDALDLSQEAFCRAYRALPDFDTSKNFYTWFYRILKNLCINFTARHKRNQEFSEPYVDTSARNPHEILEQHERTQAVWQAMEQLKENDREIIILKDFDDMSYQEISEVLDIPLGSVMSRLYYARKKLLKKLEYLNE